jgi:membrane-associated phospholipid phosphatase
MIGTEHCANGWLNWQIDYLLLLQGFRHFTGGIFDNFFSIITLFGEVFIPLMFICFLYWCVNKKYGAYIFTSYLYGFLTNTFLKITACIYRPWVLSSEVKPVASAIPAATGYSFPSGHTASCVSTWGGTALLFWQNKAIRYSLLALILLVMFSRNYLGVHTPQDVIVSLIIGVFIVVLNKKLFDWEEKAEGRDILIISAITIVNIILIAYTLLKSYPMDYLNGKLLYDPTGMKSEICSRTGFVFGAFYGWFLEKRFVKFEASLGTVFSKAIRFLAGILGVILIYALSNIFFVKVFGEIIGVFIDYLLISLFIIFLYPYILNKFNHQK